MRRRSPRTVPRRALPPRRRWAVLPAGVGLVLLVAAFAAMLPRGGEAQAAPRAGDSAVTASAPAAEHAAGQAPPPASSLSGSLAPAPPSPTGSAKGPSPSGGLRLRIGAVGIDAPVVPSGVAAGELVLPGPAEVGAVDQGNGRWLYAAHVSWDGAPGAFSRLGDVRPGMVVDVGHGARRSLYRVTTATTHRRGELPPDVFAVGGPARVVLVTCTGPRVEQRLPDGRVVVEHRDNLVVTAVPL